MFITNILEENGIKTMFYAIIASYFWGFYVKYSVWYNTQCTLYSTVNNTFFFFILQILYSVNNGGGSEGTQVGD